MKDATWYAKRKSSPEFAPKKTSKPGAVQRAQRYDDKQDRQVAKKFGVKLRG